MNRPTLALTRRLLPATLLLSLLCACGQVGALYQPPPEEPPTAGASTNGDVASRNP